MRPTPATMTYLSAPHFKLLIWTPSPPPWPSHLTSQPQTSQMPTLPTRTDNTPKYQKMKGKNIYNSTCRLIGWNTWSKKEGSSIQWSSYPIPGTVTSFTLPRQAARGCTAQSVLLTHPLVCARPRLTDVQFPVGWRNAMHYTPTHNE